jgi:hypothetical protein
MAEGAPVRMGPVTRDQFSCVIHQLDDIPEHAECPISLRNRLQGVQLNTQFLAINLIRHLAHQNSTHQISTQVALKNWQSF